MKHQTKCMLYKSLAKPILTYCSECWPLSKEDGYRLRIFEIRILRMIYGPINDNGIWRTRHSSELYTLYYQLHIVKVIKIERLRLLGHFFRMQEWDPC